MSSQGCGCSSKTGVSHPLPSSLTVIHSAPLSSTLPALQHTLPALCHNATHSVIMRHTPSQCDTLRHNAPHSVTMRYTPSSCDTYLAHSHHPAEKEGVKLLLVSPCHHQLGRAQDTAPHWASACQHSVVVGGETGHTVSWP